jgi:hypothetical protein
MPMRFLDIVVVGYRERASALEAECFERWRAARYFKGLSDEATA